MLTHIVLFKLQEPTDANADALCTRLRSLEGKVPSLRGLEAGKDVIRSERSFDVALITRFDDLDGLEAYQIHPDHQQVLAYVRRVVSEARAVDFEN